MNFDKPENLFDFTREALNSSEAMRTQLCRRMGIDGCYYEGIQWLTQSTDIHSRTSVSRLPVDFRPDSSRLRATANRTTMLTQKSAASTHPMRIDMSVDPPEHNAGEEARQMAASHELLANAAVGASGYLSAAQRANFRRCIFGTWGIGLARELTPRGEYICAFDFDPTCLVLEPSCQKIELHEHPYVMYSDTWSLDRIKRVFGIEIRPEEAQTVEQLEPMKVEMSWLSNMRLFSKYARMSRAKAARVHQLHVRGDDQRFDRWYVVVEVSKTAMNWVNEDDQESPFGGTGLPFTLLAAYPRADTMWAWGEPAQIKDEQDKANLVETQHQRIIQKHAGPGVWLADRRAFGQNATDEDIDKQFTNQVGGVIKYTGRDRVMNIAPPQMVPAPPVPQFLMDAIDRYGIQMRDKTHKAAGNFGQMQTHIADRTVERTLDEADQVASVRVAGDVKAHEYLIGVLHATQIGLIQKKNMPSIAMVRKEGFDAMDFASIMQSNPINPDITVRVAEGSFRQRSHTSRKQDLFDAAKLQMVTPEQFRSTMADTLEMPLSDQDKQIAEQIRKEVLAVIYGQPSVPKPMGEWGQKLISALILAQFDARVKDDPAALQRIQQRIQLQYQVMQQEMLMANPELQAKVQAASQPDAEEAGEPQESDPNQAVSVADVLDALSGSGAASVGGQTATA